MGWEASPKILPLSLCERLTRPRVKNVRTIVGTLVCQLQQRRIDTCNVLLSRKCLQKLNNGWVDGWMEGWTDWLNNEWTSDRNPLFKWQQKVRESDGSSEISSDRQRRVSCAADELYLSNHPPGLDMHQMNIRTWTYCKEQQQTAYNRRCNYDTKDNKASCHVTTRLNVDVTTRCTFCEPAVHEFCTSRSGPCGWNQHRGEWECSSRCLYLLHNGDHKKNKTKTKCN